MKTLSYRPDIDGLRALSVLGVIFFHAGLGFPGGYIGVDVFFVISGFLITGIILRELENGSFLLRNFWIRRIKRIIPAAAFLVLATLACACILLDPETLRDLGLHVVDPLKQFFSDGDYLVVYGDGRSFYRDDDHLTRYGVTHYYNPVFEKVLSEIQSDE